MSNFIALSHAALVDAAFRGLTIWCLETGEGFEWTGQRSKRALRRRLSWLLRTADERHTFGIIKRD